MTPSWPVLNVWISLKKLIGSNMKRNLWTFGSFYRTLIVSIRNIHYSSMKDWKLPYKFEIVEWMKYSIACTFCLKWCNEKYLCINMQQFQIEVTGPFLVEWSCTFWQHPCSIYWQTVRAQRTNSSYECFITYSYSRDNFQSFPVICFIYLENSQN